MIAIIPAAGLGTRFLPASLAVPKEMFVVLDRPVIHYIVEEALEAGIEEVVIVKNKFKSSIEEYFHPSREKIEALSKAGEINRIESILKINSRIKILYINQDEYAGLSDAIYITKKYVKGSFVVMLGDTIISGNGVNCTKELIEHHKTTGKAVIAAECINNQNDLSKYGVFDIKSRNVDGTFLLNRIVEKPKKNPPSNYCVMSRYVFRKDIFACIERSRKGDSISSAISILAKKDDVYGKIIKSTRYDIGSPEGLLSAFVGMSKM